MAILKKFTFFIISTVLHIIAGGIIFSFWQPIALWYWKYRPIIGVDFYNLTSYVAYLARHFVLPLNGWKYTWWTGVPIIKDYPILHAYLILPLLKYFSLPQAVQMYMLGACFLFLFFSYLLFSELSHNRILALLLSIILSFSIGIYGVLIWAGSLPYFATQAFLPLVIWLLVKYLNSHDYRWFLLSSMFLGISILGHLLVGVQYIIPISLLLLVTYPFKREKYFSWLKIKRILTYYLIAFIIGYPQAVTYTGKTPLSILNSIFLYLSNIFTKIFRKTAEQIPFVESENLSTNNTPAEVAQLYRDQFNRIFTNTNNLFFILLGISAVIFLVSFLVRKNRRRSLKVLVFLLPAIWVLIVIFLFSRGVDIMYIGGWYRAFWGLPVVLGMLISFIWGDFLESLKERISWLQTNFILKSIAYLVISSSVLVIAYLCLPLDSTQKILYDIETPGYRQHSSAFPDSLNYYITPEEYKDLSTRLTPSWLDPNNTQYRLYDADQRINIWWNALFDMPLFKGYVEVHPADTAGYFYWTSIALTAREGDPLVDTWGWPKETAFNNAKFLIDWFSIKYIEAEHERSDSYNPLTSYLYENDLFSNIDKVEIPGWVQLYQVPQGQSLIWHPDDIEYLTYYEVKDELVSPILHTTDAPTLGIIGTGEAYKTILRSLAATNLNSQYVIPINLGKNIDSLEDSDLQNMDALILYQYDYQNYKKTWKKLENYVSQGGEVFIETGSQVKETSSTDATFMSKGELPEIFPVKKTTKETIGSNWTLSGEGSMETREIDLHEFGPPVIDDELWQFSLPESSDDLRSGARAILSADQVPIIAAWSFGQGQVIWSGMNLPYHISVHKRMVEAQLFNNLLANFIDFEHISYGQYRAQRNSPNQVQLTGSRAKGVLFKEHKYPGWTAKVKSNQKSQKLHIYAAGPTSYGFSYVKLPDEIQTGEFEVIFSYRGEFMTYFWFIIWIVTILFILDKAVLGGRLLAPFIRKSSSLFKHNIAKWWEKEDEY